MELETSRLQLIHVLQKQLRLQLSKAMRMDLKSYIN